MAKRRVSDDNIIDMGGSSELEEMNAASRARYSHVRTGIIVVIFLAIVIAGVVAYVHFSMLEFKGYKVISSADTVFEANADYLEFGGNLLKYTPDGVSYIDHNGNVVWTAGVDFNVPIAACRGDYAVVADRGGNKVCVFNTEGMVSDNKMPYSICSIDVGIQGAFTVILEGEDSNYINMYDSAGGEVYTFRTSIDKSGYPLDITISEDGVKLFTSYFKLDGVNFKNNVAAYNFGEVGQNAGADRIVGGYTFEDEMVTRVRFVTNDIVAAFSDSEIVLYDFKEKPSQRAKIEYGSDIYSILYNKNYVGFIKKNDGDAEAENAGYVLKCYDLSGKEMFSYPFDIEYDNIYAADNEIIITGGNQCLIVSKGGRTKFTYAFPNMIKSMIPSSGSNEYIITFEGKTETIKLKAEDD
jgi:hypothetical protein